jgi:hypothetical protein
MEKQVLVDMLNIIEFDDYYLEATFQFRLMIELVRSNSVSDYKYIQPERNIKRYKLQKEEFEKKGIKKKEIDIVIEDKLGNPTVALELKMPMKGQGQTPEQMFKFVEDIQFLEELKDTGKFDQCFFIAVTNNKKFWEWKSPKTPRRGIYKYFRSPSPTPLTRKICKPTGKGKGVEAHELKGSYDIKWEKIDEDFRYCILEI